ncbi:MAG: phosphoribosylanthranilate isomerase [Ignavibacteriales bacterium]|nr:phosphoribosylanthranilate isomerase [Ignavibacteriales bacterium]
MKDLIQIAGVMDAAEAALMMQAGVHYLGFPLRLPVNKEDLTEDEAVEVIKGIRLPHKAVLITYLHKAEEIIAFCDKLHVAVVQLHGSINKDELRALKSIRPELEVIKSLVVHGDNYGNLEHIIDELSPWIDAYITDTYDPATGASGATGKTHDWAISRKLIEISPRPIMLAGGINPGNVRRAILETAPAGVDVHTGVEGPDGRKSPERLYKFVQEANLAFSELPR